MSMKSFLMYGVATAAAASLALPQQAKSADQDGNYALRGVGSAACSSYTEALTSDTQKAQGYIAWMAGYITARSRTEAETFDVLPLISGADVAGLMRVICLQNSDSSFENALDAAIRLFRPARVEMDSPLLELTHNEKKVAIRQITLAQVQTALSDLGYYESAVDGTYGPGTRTAIEKFQTDRQLQLTGLPDADTLVALLLSEQ